MCSCVQDDDVRCCASNYVKSMQLIQFSSIPYPLTYTHTEFNGVPAYTIVIRITYSHEIHNFINCLKLNFNENVLTQYHTVIYVELMIEMTMVLLVGTVKLPIPTLVDHFEFKLKKLKI